VRNVKVAAAHSSLFFENKGIENCSTNHMSSSEWGTTYICNMKLDFIMYDVLMHENGLEKELHSKSSR
jgi:hypothetical protein